MLGVEEIPPYGKSHDYLCFNDVKLRTSSGGGARLRVKLSHTTNNKDNV